MSDNLKEETTAERLAREDEEDGISDLCDHELEAIWDYYGGHKCPFADRPGYASEKHHACPACDNCDYGNSIDTTTGMCRPCWNKRSAALKAKYSDYCEKTHSCANCEVRFCVNERDVGVSYVPGLTKDAKKYLKKDLKNFCAYCLHALLERKDMACHHTGIREALAVYKRYNPRFDPEVPPVPYEEGACPRCSRRGTPEMPCLSEAAKAHLPEAYRSLCVVCVSDEGNTEPETYRSHNLKMKKAVDTYLLENPNFDAAILE